MLQTASRRPERARPASRRAGRPHTSAWIVAIAAQALSVVFVSRQAAAQTLEVDATAPGEPLEHVWTYYGYDEANYTTTAEGEALLRALVEANTATVRTRTHFLFNSGDGTPSLKWGSTNIYSEDPLGNPIYDYSLIDSILDATLRAGALPLVEIGFMPQALSSVPEPYQPSSPYLLEGGSFQPPRDYARWGQLVAAYAAHVEQRYPDAESTWQWELWNEPDIGYWQGTFEGFARLYDTTEHALHEVFPTASLGGPAVASPNRPFLAQFLEHCATGTNSVTGAVGTRLDMVSFHAKGGVTLLGRNVQMDLGNHLRLHRTGFQTVLDSAFAAAPIVISESDPDGCAACPANVAPQYGYRTSSAYGAYQVAMLKRTLDLAEEMDVNLRGVLTWAFTFPEAEYFAGYRELATRGIHLPIFNAFKLLSTLGGARVPVESTGALPLAEALELGFRGLPDIDGMATMGDGTLRVLVWNYHDDLVASPAAAVTVNVKLPQGAGPQVHFTHTRLDDEHGNAHTLWVAQGSPEAPSEVQLSELRAAMSPVVLEQRAVEITADNLSVSLELPRFGISLLEFELPEMAEPASDPSADDGSCSCHLGAGTPRSGAPSLTTGFALLPFALVLFAARRGSGRRAPQPARRRHCP